MEQKIDFSKKPEGATHYFPFSDSGLTWYKMSVAELQEPKPNYLWHYWQEGSGWTPSSNQNEREHIKKIPEEWPHISIKDLNVKVDAGKTLSSLSVQSYGVGIMNQKLGREERKKPVFTRAMHEAGELPLVGSEIEYVISPRQEEPTKGTVIAHFDGWLWVLVKIGTCNPRPYSIYPGDAGVAFVFDDEPNLKDQIAEDLKQVIPEIHWHLIAGIVSAIMRNEITSVKPDYGWPSIVDAVKDYREKYEGDANAFTNTHEARYEENKKD